MLLQQLMNGLLLGAIYALVALGYTLSYGVLKLINFAHGDIFMVGAFVAYTVSMWSRLPFLATFLLAMAGAALVGVLVERFAYRPLRKANRSTQLISTLGMSIVLQNLAMLIWGSHTLRFPTVLPTSTFNLGPATVSTIQILVVGVALLLMVALRLLIYHTRLGRAMRAVSQDSAAAQLMGVNLNRIIGATFALGSALGGAAGVLVAIYYNSVVFTMGYSVGLKAFVAAILGGIGNIPGTLVGGFLLGVAEALGAAYLFSGYKDAFAFLVLILVLLIRPAGLFGRATTQKV